MNRLWISFALSAIATAAHADIVSFCGSGVKKTGDTTVEMRATDVFPEKDVEDLLLEPFDADPTPGG